jgi:hypothetical protein
VINEVFQWVVLVIVGILVMGVLRQVALSLPPPLLSNTTSGPRVGERLPKEALADLKAVLRGGHLEQGTLVAFVIETCVACQRLLAELTGRDRTSSAKPVVLVARNASSRFRQALAESGMPTIHDDGRLWQACRVTNTPLIVKLDTEGRVLAKGVTHHVETVAGSAS